MLRIQILLIYIYLSRIRIVLTLDVFKIIFNIETWNANFYHASNVTSN